MVKNSPSVSQRCPPCFSPLYSLNPCYSSSSPFSTAFPHISLSSFFTPMKLGPVTSSFVKSYINFMPICSIGKIPPSFMAHGLCCLFLTAPPQSHPSFSICISCVRRFPLPIRMMKLFLQLLLSLLCPHHKHTLTASGHPLLLTLLFAQVLSIMSTNLLSSLYFWQQSLIQTLSLSK